MTFSATQLANDSTAVLDHVLQTHETADIQRHGKTRVQIRRKAGVSKAELLAILRSVHFTEDEQKQLTAATKEVNQVTGHAGSR